MCGSGGCRRLAKGGVMERRGKERRGRPEMGNRPTGRGEAGINEENPMLASVSGRLAAQHRQDGASRGGTRLDTPALSATPKARACSKSETHLLSARLPRVPSVATPIPPFLTPRPAFLAEQETG